MVNDAVSILLFRSVTDFVKSTQKVAGETDNDVSNDGVTASDMLLMILQFIYLAFMSILIGIAFGLLASFILKKIPSMKE